MTRPDPTTNAASRGGTNGGKFTGNTPVQVCDLGFAQRCSCPNNSLFILALILTIAFLLVELGIRIYDLYLHYPPVDIPSHLFSGLAISAGAYWILSLNKIIHKRSVSVSITFIAACFWELLEFLDEKIAPDPVHLQDKFIWDGLFDIIVTTSGGILLFLILFILRKKTHMLDISYMN